MTTIFISVLALVGKRTIFVNLSRHSKKTCKMFGRESLFQKMRHQNDVSGVPAPKNSFPKSLRTNRYMYKTSLKKTSEFERFNTTRDDVLLTEYTTLPLLYYHQTCKIIVFVLVKSHLRKVYFRKIDSPHLRDYSGFFLRCTYSNSDVAIDVLLIVILDGVYGNLPKMVK